MLGALASHGPGAWLQDARAFSVTDDYTFGAPELRRLMISYVPLFLLFAVAALLALVFFAIGPVLGKRNPTPEKLMPFECGSESSGARDVKLSVKFYFTAILFVIFDVEAVFIYPWTLQFRSVGWGGVVTMLTFLVTLALALVYVWKKGALEWEK